jgi:hypothetical protein
MGDLASDHDAAIELIIDGYRRLQAHNPEHELLQYITNVTDQGFENVRDKYDAFLDRFETPEDKKLDYVKVAKVLTSFFVALRDAADEIEGIDRKPKQPVSVTPIKTLDDIGDLPF